MNANQPCSPSHGIVLDFETNPIIAITIVGNSTTKPQKMNACMRPGPSRWNSLRWPATITTSFRTRFGTSSNRGTGLPSRISRYSCHARRANRPPATSSATARTTPATTSAAPPPPDLGRDRRHHLVQVAEHGVVGHGHDRRLAVGVHGEDPLRPLGARDVLRGARDAARDV